MLRLPLIRRWTWARRATAAAFLLALVLGRFDWFSWLKGSTSATRLLGLLWLADPMAVLEITLATREFMGSLLLAGGVVLLFYALLGRAFCGWVCPLGLVLDLNDELRERLRKWLGRRRLKLPDYPLPASTKYWLLGLALGLALGVELPVFQLISPINILARSVIFEPGSGLLLIAGLLAAEIFSRRAWCRSLCPLGAFYSLVGCFGLWRVQIDQATETAVPCRLCARSCPMGIPVVDKYIAAGKHSIEAMECTRCGVCVESCPRRTLQMG
ncbi:MAG: 4Fe-4S binding protein [Chloroflexota bacterium]